ncbi:metallophosphoesterase [Aerococcaceae bacterium 50-4]
MKLGFISDLHIDRGKTQKEADFLYTLSAYINDKELDEVYIGGDISNHHEKTINFVEKLQAHSGAKIYFIPGNHDYWEPKQDKKHTLTIHDTFKSHPQSMLNKVTMVGSDTAIVGHIGWYNHAYHDPAFTEDKLERGRHKLVTWQDKVRLDWQATDKEVSKHFAKETKDTLDQVMDQHQPKNIILFTHVITIPEFTIPMPHRVFDFFNAYIATDDYLPFYENYPIKTSLMGHVHFRHQIQQGKQDFISNSLAYEREWRNNNLYREIDHAMYIMEV